MTYHNVEYTWRGDTNERPMEEGGFDEVTENKIVNRVQAFQQTIEVLQRHVDILQKKLGIVMVPEHEAEDVTKPGVDRIPQPQRESELSSMLSQANLALRLQIARLSIISERLEL